MYDATLGRFLERDPIEQTDAVSSYDYAANNPADRVDPLGKDCCCVENLEIDNVRPFTKGKSFGHKFDLVAKLAYKPTRAFGFCDCKLKWEEKSNSPPPWQKIPANQWNDLRALFPNSPLFEKWEGRMRNPPGETVTLTDEPSIRDFDPERTLYFRITVESAHPCDCKYSRMTVYATQELDPAALGVFQIQSFRRGLFQEGSIPRFDEKEKPPPPVRIPPPPGFGRVSERTP